MPVSCFLEQQKKKNEFWLFHMKPRQVLEGREVKLLRLHVTVNTGLLEGWDGAAFFSRSTPLIMAQELSLALSN